MLVPGRSYVDPSRDYRYGFQGQEMDNDLKGRGNSLNYTFRMHDPRVGRFFAVDPLEAKYPWYSPYQFSGNRLIDMVELEGLEPAPSGAVPAPAPDFNISTETVLEIIKSIPKANPIIRVITATTTTPPIELIPEVVVSSKREGLFSGLGAFSKGIEVKINLQNSKSTTREDVLSATLEERKNNNKEGSYTIVFSNGKKYHGKGNFQRATESALRYSIFSSADENKIVLPSSIDWTESKNERDAYKDEHTRMQEDAEPENNIPQGYANPNNYNIIQSKGYKYKKEDGESTE